MRIALAALVLVAAAAGAGAAERLPSFRRNSAYADARISLRALGWMPAPVAAPDRYCTIGREDVCEAYPETASCSGSGRALCTFLWRKSERLIEVTTQGEELDHLGVAKVTCRAGC